MVEKIFENTRIQMLYDTLEQWSTNNPLLKQGEIAIVVIPASETSEQSVLFKVGDGINRFNNLGYGQGTVSWGTFSDLN